MKTVLAAKKSIAQLWGHPKPRDKKYRLMKYLLTCEVENGLLLHNVVTRQLILLTKEEAESLSNLPAEPTELMQELIADHFLVPEDFDEYRSVNQLRTIYQSRENGNAISHYVILPTTFCNAHCFYCYESDFPHIHMSEETADKLIEFIDEHREGKDVTINWFGGEPLVGIARIDQISQGLMDRGITYRSSMISNGYLFDEKIIERSVKLWHLDRVQITLDGTEEVYNRVKAYANEKESPFQRVLRNIDLLSNSKVQVIIRLNVDFYNEDDIGMLIEKLGERYNGNRNVTVYLSMLFNNQGFEPVHHSSDEMIELLRIIDGHAKRLSELGVGHNTLIIPSLQIRQCMADSPHTISIQPDGSFCRCEHESVLDRYGSLEEGILDPQKPLKWRETIERSEHCPECIVYPACYLLRGCMNSDIPCVEGFRLRNQKRYKELLRSVYLKSLEGKKNEGIRDSNG